LNGDAGILILSDSGRKAEWTPTGGKLISAAKVKRVSPTLGLAAPAGAIMLFNGNDLAEWIDAEMDGEKNLLPQGSSATQGARTKKTFSAFTLHLEFRVPFMPTQTGLQRGNSGIYLQSRYEVQILDSFGAFPEIALSQKQHCGAIWEQTAPKLPMSYPPGSWQTYDITFQPPVFNDQNQRTIKGWVTVDHNGVRIHDKTELLDRTVAGEFEGPNPLGFRFQGYGAPVAYRNIWVVSHGASSLQPRLKPNSQRQGFRFFSRNPSFANIWMGRLNLVESKNRQEVASARPEIGLP
jgi:hypothetical protein